MPKLHTAVATGAILFLMLLNATTQADEQNQDERRAAAQQKIQKVQSIVADMQKLIDVAKAEKDMVKLNYLTQKLKTLRGLLDVAQQAGHALEQALARHDVAAANHEEEKLDIIVAKADALMQQGENTIGVSMAFTSGTSVVVTINEKVAGSVNDVLLRNILTTGNSTGSAIGNTVMTVRPPAASPYF